jgi:hypothetical protein
MIAAIVVAEDNTGRPSDAMTQPNKIMVIRQRFMAIFTIGPAKQVLSPQCDGAK